MKTVFLDTNIIISGTFFSGPEADLLSHPELKLVTAGICEEELLKVTKEKFGQFGSETKKVAIKEVENSLMDIDVVVEEEYLKKLDKARNLITGKNDQKVLAAALSVNPDYFITGDQDFQKDEIVKILPVKSTGKVLEELDTS